MQLPFDILLTICCHCDDYKTVFRLIQVVPELQTYFLQHPTAAGQLVFKHIASSEWSIGEIGDIIRELDALLFSEFVVFM